MVEGGGLFLNFFEFEKSIFFFNFWPMEHLVIKICMVWSNLNTVKILFCKVAVSLIKIAIKDIKMTKKKKK